MITRKRIQYDIAHGGLYNDTFVNKGIPFYTEAEDSQINHADYFENDEDFTWTKKEDDTLGRMNIVGDAEISHDTIVNNDIYLGKDLKLGDEDTNDAGDDSAILKTDGESLYYSRGTDRQILREKEIEKDGEKVLSLEYEDPVDNVDYPTSLVRNDLIPTQETIANYNGTVEEGATTRTLPAKNIQEFLDIADEYFTKTTENIFDIYTPKVPLYSERVMPGEVKLIRYNPISNQWMLMFEEYTSGWLNDPFTYGFQLFYEESVEDYPISELRDNTTTHGNHTVENILEVKNKIKEDVYIGEHVFVGEKSDNSRLNLTDYSLVLEEEDE